MKPTGYAVMRDEGRGKDQIGAIFDSLEQAQEEQTRRWLGYVTRIVAIIPVTSFTDNSIQDPNSKDESETDDNEITLIGKAISDPGQFVPRKTGWVDRSSGKQYGERETVQQWQTRAVSKALSCSGQRARKDQQPAAGLAGYFSAMPTDIRPKAVTSILVYLDNTEAWLTAADGEQIYGIVPTVAQPEAQPTSASPAAENAEPLTDQTDEQHIRKIVKLVREYGELKYAVAVEGEKGGPGDEKRADAAAEFMLSNIRSVLALTCNVVDHARTYRQAHQQHTAGSATCASTSAECYLVEAHDALVASVDHLDIVTRYGRKCSDEQHADDTVGHRDLGELAGLVSMIIKYGDYRAAEMGEHEHGWPVDAGWEREAADSAIDKISAGMSMISDVIKAARELLGGYTSDGESLGLITQHGNTAARRALIAAIDRFDQLTSVSGD
jgi:hypothetical protein